LTLATLRGCPGAKFVEVVVGIEERGVRLAPRFGEVALELKGAGRTAGPALCLRSRLWVKV
jgi:hypothetical protein